MNFNTPLLHQDFAGFGLGLRTVHYQDLLKTSQAVDWLEVITDNFLVDGGQALLMLEKFRKQYNIAFHGVGMSIGSRQSLDIDYLKKIKQLAHQFEPLWISDHLCWTHHQQHFLHDLYPLPYTQESADFLIQQIQHAQDILERPLVIENVSSYVQYCQSQVKEWEFLSYVADQANCLLLLDLNNIYVSSVNHGFDPYDYLKFLDPNRIQQIHLAGHSRHDHYIIDTHDAAVCDEVWDLYRHACTRFGAVATMIERDDNIPALSELIDELNIAREIFNSSQHTHHSNHSPSQCVFNNREETTSHTSLQTLQQIFSTLVLETQSPIVPACFNQYGRLEAQQGLLIYHHAYRARLVEVLADVFPHTLLFCGTDYFEKLTHAYIQDHTPSSRSLNDYGDHFADFLKHLHPESAALFELAQIEWALRSVFYLATTPSWTISHIQTHSVSSCLDQRSIVLDSVKIFFHESNAWQIWKAIQADQEVPPSECKNHSSEASNYCVLVWRYQHQPQFLIIDYLQAQFLRELQTSQMSISELTELWINQQRIPNTEVLAQWLELWWTHEILSFQYLQAC